MQRIKITENGPYIVSGGIPLREVSITLSDNGHYNYRSDGMTYETGDTYALCRCGRSKNPPFCDASHLQGFKGTEVASRAHYTDRIEDVVMGKTIRLLDDGRCAYARFCHSDQGNIWAMTEQEHKYPEFRDAVIAVAHQCPSGRLTAVDLDGHVPEEDDEPEILIAQDPDQSVSAGIWVKGPVVIEAADGTEYEVRNRVALCRCGKSRLKPFCDASHVNAGFKA